MKHIIFKKVPVSLNHIGKVHFCTNVSNQKLCGVIECYSDDESEMFICKHEPKKGDPFKTTGTVITHVYEEIDLGDLKFSTDEATPDFVCGINYILDKIKK